MTEPTTEAGRWLSGMKLLVGNRAAFVADILAIEAEARADALREAADKVERLPMYGAPAGTHGSPEADAYWQPSVSARAVLAILDPETGP